GAVVKLKVSAFFIFGGNQHERFARYLQLGESVAVGRGGLDHLLLVVEQLHLHTGHRLGGKDAGGDDVRAVVVAAFDDEADVRCQHVAARPAPGGIVCTVAGIVAFVPIVIVRVVIVVAPPKSVFLINRFSILLTSLLCFAFHNGSGVGIAARVHRIAMAEADQYAVDGSRS